MSGVDCGEEGSGREGKSSENGNTCMVLPVLSVFPVLVPFILTAALVKNSFKNSPFTDGGFEAWGIIFIFIGG